MAYGGRSFDRICPAGKTGGNYEITVAACLRSYAAEDAPDSAKHERPRPAQGPFRLPSLKNWRNTGLGTDIRNTMRMPVQTNFRAVINELKETHCSSSWNKVLGKSEYRTNYLPMDAHEMTFGKKTEKGTTMKELINPDKPRIQVTLESDRGHDLYKKTHDDYDINEKIDRKYPRPSYNPNAIKGMRTAYDPRGIWVKRCMHWKKTDPLVYCNSIQSEHQRKNVPKLGESSTPNKNIERVPEGHSFGNSCNDTYGVGELLTNCPSKQDIQECLALFNSLQTDLKRRYGKMNFSFDKFHDAMKYFDKNHNGWITRHNAYEICSHYNVHFEKNIAEPVLVKLKILKDDEINYKKFVELLNWKRVFPEIGRINDTSPKCLHYLTTSKAADLDKRTIDNSKGPCAGIPSVRHDIPTPKTPAFGCYADRDNLGEFTNTSTLLNPSVFSQYGITYCDLLQPREKNEIRNIFKAADFEFSDDAFDKLWNESIDGDGYVSVDSFYKLVKNDSVC